MATFEHSVFAVNSTGSEISDVRVSYDTKGSQTFIEVRSLWEAHNSPVETITSVKGESDRWTVSFVLGDQRKEAKDFKSVVHNRPGTYTVVLLENDVVIVKEDGSTTKQSLKSLQIA